MKQQSHPFFAIIFLSIAVFFGVYMLGKISFIERIWNIVNDTLTYKLQYNQNRHSEDIVILKIDDRTLESLGQSDLWMIAFDKWAYATLIENIFTNYKASVLGVDIVFANPSVLGRQDEEKLKIVLETYQKQVVIATRSDYKPYPLCLYSGVQHGAIDTIEQDRLRTFRIIPFAYNLSTLCPETEISEKNKENISTLSREVLELYKENTSPFEKEKIEKNLKIFDAKDAGLAYIEYYSNGKKNEGTLWYESYSFIDIYNGKQKTPDGKTIDLQGKIVLLGEVGTLIHDSHFTPVSQNIKMPWVEINANIITTMQEGRNITDAPIYFTFLLFFVLQMGVIASVLYLRIVAAITILFTIIGVLLGFWGWMFILGSLYDIFLWILACILSFIFAYIYRFQVTDKAKRALKKQFSSYVPADIVEEISKNPDSVLIQWEKREMSIFFSDIVSFTNISEQIDPEKIVTLLNEYFSEMTKIIHHNKGTLDKYIGDSVMCFFNAPLKQENHSFYACETALQQQKRLKELNQAWQIQGFPEIKIRIGLHTGEAVHGNIGSTDTRVSYTIIGDSVNLASRLEGVCKEYAVFICVSQTIYDLQKDAFHFRELDTIAVKWKKQAVNIYQLLGSKSSQIPEKNQEYLRKYAEGLVYYREENYKKAGALWLENKADPTSFCMAQRCKDILEGKAQVEQGVFIMTHK